MDDDGVGILIAGVVIMGLVAMVLTVLFYVAIFLAAAAAIGVVIYGLFIVLKRVALIVWEACQPTPDELIERDFKSTKTEMNDIAGQSWRNLAG